MVENARSRLISFCGRYIENAKTIVTIAPTTTIHPITGSTGPEHMSARAKMYTPTLTIDAP